MYLSVSMSLILAGIAFLITVSLFSMAGRTFSSREFSTVGVILKVFRYLSTSDSCTSS